MIKEGAIYQFLHGFGLEAYEENAVYSMKEPPAMPYLTCELNTGSFADEISIPISVNLYYRSASWAAINAKSEEISAAIGYGGRIIDFDGGHIWVKRGTPFAQSLGDPSDDMVRRKLLNLQLEFFSEN